MLQNFKQDILDLIEVSRNNYLGMPARIAADYDNEKGLIKAYNGRQVLEMLQNADDAEALRVEIKLDVDNRQLTISNTGTPFNKNGVQSLMLAGASKKTKKTYIGNKGLGFRSILNWSELVEINTNGCILSFSPEIAKRNYRSLPLSNEQWTELHTDSKYRESTIPFAILALPELRDADNDNNMWSTAVTITYDKNYERSIIEQLLIVGEECLLFLNHITQLDIIGMPAGDRHFKKNKNEGNRSDKITINGRSWEVYKVEGMFEEGQDRGDQEEDEYYSLKVAVNETLSDNIGKLFSFFPTLVSFPLPCVVHATFELDPSRNAIVKLEKNVFLLDELKKLLVSISEDMSKSDQKWNAFRLLTPLNENSDDSQVKTFYESLKKARDKARIFPTVDGQMRFLNSVRFYNNDFTKFIQQIDIEHFNELLLPFDETISLSLFIDKRYSDDEFANRINLINPLLTINQRAALIKFVSEFNFNNHKQKYPLLINDREQVIPVSHTCYTPLLKEDTQFELPVSLEIEFMNTQLYHELLDLYKKRGVSSPSRELQNEIKNAVNLQPYDSNQVTDRIISHANSLMQNKSTLERGKIVLEMVRALWSNFSSSPKSGKYGAPIPLVSLSLGIYQSTVLLYSKDYSKGQLVSDVYRDALQDYQYIAPLEYYDLKIAPDPSQHLRLVEDFFRWMGVNDLTIIEAAEVNLQSSTEYYRYVENTQQGFISGSTLKVIDTEIRDFDKIQRKLSLEQLVLWTIKCDVIQNALRSSAKEVVAVRNGKTTKYYNLRSYIHQQLFQCGKIQNYVIENYSIPSVNLKIINYKSELFSRYGITKPEIDSALIKLGAVEKFEDFTAERVFEILALSQTTDSEGNFAQRLYKLALKWYDTFQGILPGRPSIAYFAKKGEEKGYRLGKVYYSDNQALPKHILKDFAILDLPKRSGEDKVAKLFHISNFKDIPISILSETITIHPLEKTFHRYWRQIIDMVLAYRIEKFTGKSDKDTAANNIKQFKINLVLSCNFEFDGRLVEMQENNMINISNQFYICVAQGASELQHLKNNPDFCDAFAESLCILFKVTELKNDFRRIFKNDILDSLHLISQDLTSGTWQEAKSLLGVSDLEQRFWEGIFLAMNVQPDERVKEEGVTAETLLSLFGGEKLDYAPGMLENLTSLQTFNFLREFAQRLPENTIIDLLRGLDRGSGFRNIHIERTKAVLKDFKLNTKKAIWKALSEGSLEEKMTYKTLLSHYSVRMIDKMIPLIGGYDFSFEMPYQALVIDTILNVYTLKSLDGLEEIDPVNLYPSLYSDIAGQSISDELFSLFYFTGMQDEITARMPTTVIDQGEMFHDVDPAEYHVEMLDGSDFSAGFFAGATARAGHNHSWTADANVDHAKRAAGKRSEEAVFKCLVKKYGKENVDWRSGYSNVIDKDDNLHYDMEYRNEDGKWKMVEVKTFNNNTFIISRKEVEMGCQNWKDYEIALVDHDRISFIKDFFKDADPSRFESNNMYTVTSKDFFVSLTRKGKESQLKV